MGWFSKKVKGFEDEREILITAKGILKNGTLPEPSIRDGISQAMKDLNYREAAIGERGEVSVTSQLRSYGRTGMPTLDALEQWGKTAGADAVQKAFESAIQCLQRGR